MATQNEEKHDVMILVSIEEKQSRCVEYSQAAGGVIDLAWGSLVATVQ